MEVETLTVGAFGSNCFLMANKAGDALVIDPGDEADRIIDALRTRQWRVAAYLITHGHVDHVSALAAVHRAFPAPVAMHPVDAAWAFSERNAMPPLYDVPEAPSQIDRSIAEGQTWEDIGLRYHVLEVPGHSPGHVAFHFPDQALLFSGDVIFQGTVGRTDLPGGDSRVLTQSLRRLVTLPDDTRIFCGHGPDTVLAEEKRINPFMKYFANPQAPGSGLP